jgi:hypothetical protein
MNQLHGHIPRLPASLFQKKALSRVVGIGGNGHYQ